MSLQRWIILVALLCVAAVEPAAADVRESNDIAYGSHPLQKLDVCWPESDRGASMLLLFHGGGWQAGDKRGDPGLCRLAAERGMVGVRVNYRLATGEPDTMWPAQLDDALAALQWVRSHAAEYGGDPKRVCALGLSAGGHLAVFLAVRKEVACAVDGFGPVDLTTYHTPVRKLFGDADDGATLKRKEREASPVFLVNRDTPPILIMQGTKDTMVEPSQSYGLVDALRRVGAPYKLITYEGGHGYRGISLAERQKIFEKALEFVADVTHGQKIH